MTDEEIIASLRAAQRSRTPSQLAMLLRELVGDLRQGHIVTMFKRAFPTIPLRVAIDASAWHGVQGSQRGLSDEEFDTLLSPWLPTQ